MWIKLLQAWNGHAIGTELNLAQETADQLVTAGTASGIEAPSQVTQLTQGITTAVVQGIQSALPAMVEAEVGRRMEQASSSSDSNANSSTSGAPGGVGSEVTDIHDRSGDNPTGGFVLFSEFAGCVQQACRPGIGLSSIDPRLLQLAATGMSEGDDAGGGYIIPPEHRAGLLKLAVERSALSSRAQAIPMSSNSIDIPAILDTDRSSFNRNGGVRVYWIEEAAQKTHSRPKFRKIGLKLNELAGLVYVTNTLLEDSPISLEPLLGTMFADEFAWVVDDSLIQGTGGGQPLGILNAGCLVTTPKEAGQAATTIVTENVINMYSRMWGPSLGSSVWFANSEILPQLMTMSIAVGTGGVPLWIPGNSLAGAPHGTLLGRPLVFIEQGSALGIAKLLVW